MKSSLVLVVLFLSFAVSDPESAIAQQESSLEQSDVVVLLHGMARHPDSMDKIEIAFQEKGYATHNEGYPSREYTVEMAVDSVLYPQILAMDLQEGQKLHFVTHSLGGIITRYLLKKHPELPVGRVVMLAPPNKGSELVDTFRKVPVLAKSLNGPAFFQLGTGEDSFVNQLGPVDFECGVITGNKTWNALYSTIIPGNDDGKVSVDNAKVDGMKDFLTLPANHTFIMRNEEVIRQTTHFIENGVFDQVES